ncbi:MAG TPA: sugar phosphate isomerase/epimerase family protein [Gemmata sp.]|nr:sugar phosphate isomerase/epimerase family protein [Gemmata sp.]
MTVTRRQFIAASAALAVSPVTAIDPIKRPSNKPDLKLSLAAYSMRDFLDLKKKRTMTLFQFIDFAAELPLDAVELTSYYWAEKSDDYLEKLKTHAAKKKLAVSGVPVGNNFCQRDPAKWKAEVQSVKEWTERAAKIGAPTVRIFAGAVQKGDTLADAQKRVVAGLEECCPVAEKLGVMLALENHGGITDTPEHLLELVKPVKSKALGVNIDTGNFHTPNPYTDIAKIAPYGVVTQVKTEVYPNQKREDADLAKVVKILKDANFHGFVALEYEAKEDPKVAVPRFVKELRNLISG